MRCRVKYIYIYGTGKTAQKYYDQIDVNQFVVKGFIDSYLIQGDFHGIDIINIENMIYTDDWQDETVEIHVASIHYEIVDLLIEKQLSIKRIVLCDYKLYKQYVQKNDVDIKTNIPLVVMQPMHYSQTLVMDSRVGSREILDDYCRYNTLLLLGKEIEKQNINGCCAELGVFQGAFAKYINQLFPMRKIYLFDTFLGFPETSIRIELENSQHQDGQFYTQRFSKTSVRLVLDKMVRPENCIIMEGIFPAKLPDCEEVFAFVSIDCDLYQPAMDGLKYFYPRLAKGGYIMMHDYNGKTYRGIAKAVAEYEQENGILAKVPIPDMFGSVVITK